MKGLYNNKSSSSNSCLPTAITCLLTAVLVGLMVNAYLTFALTREIAHTRNVALEQLQGSILGRLVLMGGDDFTMFHGWWAAITANNNNTIPLLIAKDLYFNFQKTAAGVAEMAKRVSQTIASTYTLVPLQVIGVYAQIEYYANMVESIALTVSKIPPMQRQQPQPQPQPQPEPTHEDGASEDSEGGDDSMQTSEAVAVAVADDDFNLMQALTNVIEELPPWFDKQLNVSDWRQLGKACNQLMSNVLRVTWDGRFDCDWWDTQKSCYWEIPYEIERDVFQTAQSVCWAVANWRIPAPDADADTNADDSTIDPVPAAAPAVTATAPAASVTY
eukprot:TRINITY_DN96_c0_g1_i1.p1 TRINITY_DN96_c0_g1~~TRINITY_DN96_c0_g1_i1.p1  ORF type:complete len:331 (+),score=77.39 TRINITY_DN96_c0_g1_i1:166-1158(+)